MPSSQRIAASEQLEHKSHTVVSAAVMFHDVLKTALPLSKVFKSCRESLALYRVAFGGFLVFCLWIRLLCIFNLKDQRKFQHFSLLMRFVSLLWCEIKIWGRVTCNYAQFVNVILRKLGFFKNYVHWPSVYYFLVNAVGQIMLCELLGLIILMSNSVLQLNIHCCLFTCKILII